jgi:hypothetical protein
MCVFAELGQANFATNNVGASGSQGFLWLDGCAFIGAAPRLPVANRIFFSGVEVRVEADFELNKCKLNTFGVPAAAQCVVKCPGLARRPKVVQTEAC